MRASGKNKQSRLLSDRWLGLPKFPLKHAREGPLPLSVMVGVKAEAHTTCGFVVIPVVSTSPGLGIQAFALPGWTKFA